MKILQSRAFLLALTLLLLNDFIFKYTWSNALTGKVSDFAGLFIFPLFWFALFPRYKKIVCTLSALFFLWWKSPLADGFLEAWNNLAFVHWERVVDYTDYWALLSIPLAYYYATQVSYRRVKIEPAFVGLLVSFSFLATSAEKPIICALDYPPMTVLEITNDSLPTTPPIRLRSMGYGNLVHPHYIGSNHLNGPEVSSLAIQGKYLILQYPYWSFMQSRYDTKNFIDQQKLEIRREEIYENLKKNIIDTTKMIELPAVELTYDSLVSPQTLKLALDDFKLVDHFQLDTIVFGARHQLQFKNSLLHGPFVAYHPSGTLKSKGNYKAGLLDGRWEKFDEQGERLNVELYDEGKLISYAKGKNTELSSLVDRRQRIYWYNVLCLVGLLLLAGYTLYRTIKAVVTTKDFKARNSFWAFIGHIFMSLSSSLMVLIVGGLLTMLLVMFFKETSILPARYIPRLELLGYLLLTIVFFMYTEKHRYFILFAIGFVLIYFIGNEWFFLWELELVEGAKLR
ncbi:MAG: toxin-antitoxin system YwqK family antitoxin [Saprospiraceae bacterium]